jgi:hypothetical protein
MRNKWKHVGSAEWAFFTFLPPYREVVEDLETGERRVVFRHPNQTIGEAIEKGQFEERKK